MEGEDNIAVKTLLFDLALDLLVTVTAERDAHQSANAPVPTGLCVSRQ